MKRIIPLLLALALLLSGTSAFACTGLYVGKQVSEDGATILNVAAGAKTPEIVAEIRERFPEYPIIATGGPTEESIRQTIEAGANAITWTPPSSAELFTDVMKNYREGKPHP